LFKILKNFFHDNSDVEIKVFSDLHLLCGIMIEAANIDGKIDQIEVNKISKALIEIFNEKPTEVEIELNKCLDELDQHKSLHFFTSKINKSFSSQKKLILIEILWEIILEDGELHDFESNLVRRLAGLLYISDTQCGIAKKKALEKL
jgi:uncharacterized tellurite resistance protein B-like protein